MKRRTVAIACSFGQVVGLCAATAILIVAVAETLACISCCLQSEREE